MANRVHGTCTQCRAGWVPGTLKTFHPGCPGCTAKVLDGRRTGLEPRPSKGPKKGWNLYPNYLKVQRKIQNAPG